MEQSKLFSTATLFFCILLVFFVKKLGKERNNSTPKLPPGPWKLPIIGSLIHLIGDQPHHRLSSLAKIYGPLFQLKLGEIDFMIISSAELACEVMKTHDINFASRPQITVGKVVFYNSSDIIFSPYGKYWWNLRKICSMHIFSAKRVKSFGSMRVEEANKLMEKIRVAAGSPVNLSELFSSAANAAVSRASFGRECGHMQKFLLAVDEMRKLSSGFELADLFPSLSFLGGLTGLTSRLRELTVAGMLS
ncbi:hypothetical protein HPP92_013653 [Vanilla planifolia]|uniref:Cytochrome P450 n=1 Tax=Vanilla planifolia TaxID=51239 RepID=A0A835QYZ0_VANPL|nr:hypothetical protein HPP92_014090 [Vanilla planifolia]KAG0478934.1 hypothetical protein HPP92_013653 [Vanilla planifolia]